MESEASHRRQKRSKHTSSAQDSNLKSVVLPADLINEILLRLPVKSLVKFKCVSKFWFDLISCPKFVKSHLSLSANNEARHRLIMGFYPPENNLKDCSFSSVLHDRVTMAIDLDYPRKESYHYIKVVGSVNGLICVAVDAKDLFIWNPSIRKFKKLPGSRTGSFYMYGFGYDELHDDYKVVEVTQNVSNDYSRYNVGNIYSLNDDSWKRLDDIHIAMQVDKSGMLVNGKLHWAITDKVFSVYNDWDILVFDLALERWEKMENPFYEEENFYFTPFLGVLGNDLSMFCYRQVNDADLWVMKEYGVKESWTKMFNIRYVGYSLFGPHFCMSIEGEILFKNGSVFMIYNPNDGSTRFPEVTNSRNLADAKLYVESLVWPFVEKCSMNATTSKATQTQMKIHNPVINNYDVDAING